MQDRQPLFNFPLKNTSGAFCPSSFTTLTADHQKKINSFSLLGLIASISSCGIAFSWHQPVKAQTSIFNDQSQTLIQEIPALDNYSPNIPQESSVISDLSHNQLEILPISLQTNSQPQNSTNGIPQLPSLAIADTTEKKATKRIYTVKSGDTIAEIARQHGISSSQLIEANQLVNPNFINVNLKLIIPNLELAQADNYQNIDQENNQQYSINNNLIAQNYIAPSASFSPLVDKKAESRDKKTDAVTVTNTIEDNESTNSNLTQPQDPYISKLRQDIIKLRDKYQNQNGDNETLTTEATITQATTSENDSENNLVVIVEDQTKQTQANNSPSSRQYPIAAAPEPKVDLNSLISLVPDNTITPNLPPLASPEEYLPNNPIFDGYIWPAQGAFTSGYGWRWGRMHKGIDIAAPIGTPIMAAAPGEVIFAGWNTGGYGNLVELRHSDGSVTFYAHNNRILVSNGQKVKQGQIIAEMGSTGRSTGPHLHFEIRPNGSTPINPIALLPKTR